MGERLQRTVTRAIFSRPLSLVLDSAVAEIFCVSCAWIHRAQYPVCIALLSSQKYSGQMDGEKMISPKQCRLPFFAVGLPLGIPVFLLP